MLEDLWFELYLLAIVESNEKAFRNDGFFV